MSDKLNLSDTRNSNRVIHFQIGTTTEGQSVIMFTDYPDFCNSGSPAAAGLCTEDVISKAILHKIILILYLTCLYKGFYFPIWENCTGS